MGRLRVVLSLLIVLVMAISASATTLTRKHGDFELFVSDDGGAFSVLYAPEDQPPVNFFVPHNDFASTYFSIMANGVAYRLRRGSLSDISIGESEEGLQLRYLVKDKLEVDMYLSFVQEFAGGTQAALKVQVDISNVSAEKMDVALKGIFDTFLGENADVHFMSAQIPYIENERSFSAVGDLQWVRSTNGNESVQFLLDGNSITTPSLVLLSNKDILVGRAWVPAVKPGRTFNSVFSYNNSAVCVLWDNLSLLPETMGTVTFYLSFASKAKLPPTAQFLGDKPVQKPLTDDNKITYEDDHGVVYTLGSLTDSMLNSKYITDLLNKIKRLEENPDNIDRNEVLRLHAELDAILEKVRRL